MEDRKRNPDELLKHIEEMEEQKGKGQLKIFFGYAAGVGKTYAMLESAHNAVKAGVDVVIGYVEPHTRPETMALTKGLELLPNFIVSHKNVILKEFDLDAVLARKPKLILVDELAHTNAKICRHEKRYQDVKELLNAGIDVYTTVNVQHLESLNDVIAGITGVAVRERIPDSVFDEASQVELVDVEPVELLERLKQGKIYKSSQAQKARDNFFTLDNLIALREIALRRMADRVNLIQEKNYWTNTEAEGFSVEHILICLSPSPSNEKVIRQAARMAKAFRGKFTAFYVETPGFSELTKENLDRLNKNIRLAEQLGAKVVTSYGSDIVEQIAEYAKVARVSKIVLGRTYTKRNPFSVKDSFSIRLTKMAPNMEVFLVPDSYEKKYVEKKRNNFLKKEYVWKDSLSTGGILIISTIVSSIIRNLGFSEANIIMIYILGVLFTSLATKRRIFSILYSMISVVVFNFFFVEPVYTFNVADSEYLVTFFIMFLTALISSSLTQKVKNYAKVIARKSYRTEILLETSQKLQKANSPNEIVENTAEQLGKLLEKDIYIFLGNPEFNKVAYTFTYKNRTEKETVLNRQEVGVAEWTYKNNKHAGFSTTTLPGARCLYLAVRNGDKVFAVVGINMEKKEIPAFEKDVMGAILNECAFALEKSELIQEQRDTAVNLEQERIRANLLRSISHDLRTPLTSISGNAGILLGTDKKIDETQRQKLYLDIYDDAMWLINLVENLLSVTRIENGTINLNLQPELLSDVVFEALRHINRMSIEHKISVVEEDDMLVAKMDAKLIMQVIINLVDNAIKYTEEGSEIIIRTKKRKQEIVVEVTDNGRGIAENQKERLFDLFYNVDNNVADGRRGMGLGLALCKSIITAHGGKISVHDNIPSGTVFRFTLQAEEVSIDDK